MAKVSGKQLTLSKIKILPIMTAQECWLDALIQNEIKIIGKIPADIALDICQKRGMFPEASRTIYDCGVVLHFEEQLFLTLVPSTPEDFYLLHYEYHKKYAQYMDNWSQEDKELKSELDDLKETLTRYQNIISKQYRFLFI